MADPLSIAASIAGLVSLAGSVFGVLCQLTADLKDYKREINELQTEVRSLSVLLHDLSLLATALETEPTLDSSFRLEHVDACERTLYEVKTRLEKTRPSASKLPVAKGSRAKASLTSTISRLKWPYSIKEFQKLLADLTHHKETIGLALSADSMKALLQMLSKHSDMSDELTDIRETVKEIKTRIFIDQHRQKVLDYFTPVNPQVYLETSLQLRHPLTGLWLTEEQDFKTWISEQNAKLWMSGIPGAGKTVIAGSIIEEVLMTASRSNTIGVCFYFCDYKDPKSLDWANILSSLASQLARQNDRVYTILESYYAGLHPDRGLPRPVAPNQILGIVSQMITLFDRVMVIVDGLDECGPNSAVPVALAELAETSPEVSMALLSRPDYDIRQAIESNFMHIDIAAKGTDVRRYVREELEERIQQRRLRLRSQALKEDIINTLIEKAGGMQVNSPHLDYLCDLPMDKDRREALDKLPPTLNATYERILSQYTHPSTVHIICTSLRLVAAFGPRITIAALCEAVSISNDVADDPVQEEDIARYCSSLLRKSPNRQHFEFAHFTVQEFLQSAERLGSPLAEYYVGPDNIAIILDLCLRFLLFQEFQLNTSVVATPERAAELARSICEQHPFYTVAACEWPFLDPKFLRDVNRQETCSSTNGAVNPFIGASDRACMLFKEEGRRQFRLWAVVFCQQFQRQYHPRSDEAVAASSAAILDGSFSALHMACALALPVLITSVAGMVRESLLVEYAISPGACLVIGLPVLLFEKLPVEGECQIPDNSVQIWDDNKVPVEIWTDAMAMLAEYDIGFPDTVEMGGTQESTLRFILWRHESDFRSHPDPTQGFEKLLLAGLDTDLGAILQLESATAVYCSRGNPNRDELKDRLHLIAKALELERDIYDQDDIEEAAEIAETIKRTVANLSPNPCLPDARQIEALSDFTFTSNVYNAVLSNNIPVLELYSADQRYKKMERGTHPDTPLLHLALESNCHEAFQYLLTAGCSDSTANWEGSTVWHRLAESGSLRFLKALKDLSEDPGSRQEDRNSEGYTPLRLAVKNKHPSVYELAFHGGVGSVELMKAIASAEISTEEARLPIHQVPLNADLLTLKQWTSVWPESRDKRYRGQLPIEILLEKLPVYEGVVLDKGILIELMPTARSSQFEVYRFFCSSVIVSNMASPATSPHFPKLLGVVLGVLADIPKLSLQPLIEAFLTYINALEAGKDGEPGWPGMTELDMVINRILIANINDIEATDREELLTLTTYIATFLNWEAVCDTCLSSGSSMYDKLDVESALEIACHPLSLCSESTLATLLSGGDILSPYSLNPLIFVLIDGKDVAEKLTLLLEHGADANTKHPESGEPAVIYHLLHGSSILASVLLKHGADPLSQLECGFDVVCGFIWNDMDDELEAFQQKHPRLDWSKSFSFPSKLAPEHRFSRYLDQEDIEEFTLLHLAAFQGSFKCLRYLVEGGLVIDINAPTADEWTCVHFMAVCGSSEIDKAMGYLQSHGCDINAKGPNTETALDFIIVCNVPPQTVHALLNLGARWSKTDCFRSANMYSACAILEYAHPLLMEDPSTGESMAEAMLYVLLNAVKHGDISIIKRLDALGCPLGEPFPGCVQCSPLLHASYHEQWTVVDWLLDYDGAIWASECKLIGRSHNPISLAAKDSELNPILERLLDHFHSSWQLWLIGETSPIIQAIAAGNIDGLRIILRFIAAKASERNGGLGIPRTADILNTPRTNMALHEAARAGNEPALQLLIDHGAALDAQDITGKAAVYYAATSGRYEALELLLRHGATASKPSPKYPSLLHLAANYDDLYLLKLAYPYYIAGNMASPLVVAYLSPFSFCHSKECVRYLLSQGLTFGGPDAMGISAVHWLLGRERIQSWILQSHFLNTHNLDTEPVNLQELQIDQTISRSIINAIPKLLRVLGKDCTRAMFPSRPPAAFNALCLAAEYGALESCRVLVSIGADLDYPGHPWGTPLAVALQFRHMDVARYLVRAGAKVVHFGGSLRERRCASVLRAAYWYPESVRWLLVERFTEQRMITAG
ncbi:uncharacterized protein DSM5745_01030 [Aspergillus mulundensis]|uniref:Fungal N-terminal domain-containing protein n=1 Tax=Aspergillus mulundensis TaxID=1810919 RepID=A0A3D8T6R3_9EURO|nr:hypothetical protein DSM5745_01030 [Aspergillus mulundensis]RDW93708.1 hypothetical protein DSM5745_01030 [Aspergillus mulundensis]